jgi:LDH2 family malate/lactate/ureidoglycolate dehydrogenase
MQAAFDDAGVVPESSAHAVRSMIETSLRGIDSDGVNLFPHYVRAVRSGRVNTKPAIAIVSRAPGVALVEADHAFGHHSGSVAIEEARRMADTTGIAAVAVKDSTHLGALAYFGLQVARRGYSGLAFTSGDALVKLFGGRAPYFGTNPLCFTAPLANEEPFCLDMATSQVSWNKIKNHPRDVPLQPGWACDENGEPTRDASAARMLEAIGGYKGYDLGMVIDILCGVLAGGPVGREILAMYKAPIEARRYISHFFMVIDPERFIGRDALARRLQSIVDDIRAQPGTVMVAGDPEKRALAERSRTGIPLDDAKFDEFLEITPAVKETVIA